MSDKILELVAEYGANCKVGDQLAMDACFDAVRAALSGAGSVGEAPAGHVNLQTRRGDRILWTNGALPHGTPLYAHPPTSIPAGHATDSDAVDAKRYRLLRRKVCIVGGAFHIINLAPTYCAPDAAIELDAAIDAAMTTTPEKESEK